MHKVMHVDGIVIHFRDNTPDQTVILSTLKKGEFAAIKGLVPDLKFGLIIDAGGYIGTAAIALSRMYPQARVVSVEPSLENFALLEKNIAPFQNIVAINAALVGVRRDVRLYDRLTGQWGFTILQQPRDRRDPAEIQVVRGITVSDILAQFSFEGIDILKLDIEGGELEVFEHSDQWIRHVGLIVAELHDRIQKGCTTVFASKTAGMRIVGSRGEKVIGINDEIFSNSS